MIGPNQLNQMLDKILLFDNKIEKLNMEIRVELLSKSKIDSKLYFKNLTKIINEYESSINTINSLSKKTPEHIH